MPFMWMALLAVLSGVLVSWPLWRQVHQDRVAASGLSRRVYEERLAEMHVDLAEGEIGQEEFDAIKLELARTLLAEQVNDPLESSAMAHRGWAWGVLMAVVLLGGGLYARGLYQPALLTWWQLEGRLGPDVDRVITGQQPQLPPGSYGLADFVRVLQTRVEASPDHFDLWEGLGMSYMQLSMPDMAAIAFDHANRLHPGDASLELALAHARVYSDNGQLDEATRDLLLDVLKQEPGQVGAELLLAEGSYNVGDYARAVPLYEALLADPSIGLDAADKSVFEQHLQDARSRAQADAVHAAQVTRLQVQVQLPADLRQEYPQATVFVFAQALQGPPMPLAVVRHVVADMPAQVVLDDTQAMLPALKVSAFPQVTVSALLSLHGQAMPQPGDYVSAHVTTATAGEQHVSLSLDQVVR